LIKLSTQYDKKLSRQYSSGERFEHPIGHMNYETWLRELGDIRGLNVLDLACGSGHSSRLLAECGAIVTGVDISPDMIALAMSEERRKPFGIKYFLGDARNLDLKREFDIVTQTYLLHYAETNVELHSFCHSVSRHLVRGGRMVALHASSNPIVPVMQNGQHSTKWLDEPFQEGSRILLSLYNLDGDEVCTIIFVYWSMPTYYEALQSAGLLDAKWVKIQMSDDAKQVLPNWKELDEYNTSAILTAIKV